MLLERSRELAAIDELVSGVAVGRQGVLLFEGPAGIGKTTLLELAAERGRDAGLMVLLARGGELEHALPFGIAAQLFDRAVHDLDRAGRDLVLDDAAGLAGPVLGIGKRSAVEAAAAMHGLYWLCANLADRSPLLVLVDDLHWCDEETLRWISYFVRRIEGVRAGVIVAARSAEPGASSQR
jgi:hypothetical protein